MDRQVGEVEGFGGLLGGGLAARAGEELAKTPAHEACVVVETDETFFGIEREELRQELRRLGTGPGEGGIDGAEKGGKGLGLVKLEQPAADLSALWTDGEQVEELLVLLRGAVRGEQALQGGGIEMFVLHAILL